MHPFTLVFIAVLAAATLLQLWLGRRHDRRVLAHRDAVPEDFAGRIGLNAHRKAADYTRAKLAFGRWDLVFGAALTLVWTLGGGLNALDALWRPLGLEPVWTGVGVILSLTVIGGLLELPFELWRTFRIEARFGFNRVGPGLFFADKLKGALLGLALGVPLLWAALTLMEGAGALWWLYLWAVWMGFSLFMAWAWPVLIAPLFNKFTPLEDTALKARIEGLLERCGFTGKGIFVMDGSRRSAHGNAYFTGFGTNKRIVFFDTLLNSLNPQQVEAVLAHELGHFKLRHIRIRLAAMAALALGSLALLGWLSDQAWFYAALGVSTPSSHMALLLFLLAGPPFALALSPLTAALSRKHEFEADAYAARQADAGDLVDALVKLYEDNANTLTPDPLYSAFYDSHPPAPIRVARLRVLTADEEKESRLRGGRGYTRCG